MNQIKLLLVEDDPGLGRGLTLSLEAEFYKVTWVKSLKSALEEVAHPYQLILLDLNLPDGNGIEFLKKIRRENIQTPTIILTAQTQEDFVVDGLSSGASDYIKKPFGHRELLARIKTALRTQETAVAAPLDQELHYHDLSVYLDKRKATFQNREIDLNRREFDILAYFVLHAEAVVTRESLLSQFDKEGELFDRTIDSHVSHLRSRLKKAGVGTIRINSVYGVGYRLEEITLGQKL